MTLTIPSLDIQDWNPEPKIVTYVDEEALMQDVFKTALIIIATKTIVDILKNQDGGEV